MGWVNHATDNCRLRQNDDEYLSGMTFDEMTGADQVPKRDDDHRYQF